MALLAVAAQLASGGGEPKVVRDAAGLAAALERARGGEVLQLAPGNYGTLSLYRRHFAQPVTITSQDPQKPALVERLQLNEVSNVTFSELEFGGALRSNEKEYSKYAEVRDSQDLRFDRVFIHGSLDSNAENDGWGIYFGDCKNIALTNSRIQQVMRAAVFERSSNIAVKQNSFAEMRSDGANFASVQNVVVDMNRFSGFHPVGTDHGDAIQFWTLSGPQSTDIVISNNVLLEGEGTGPQGILMNGARTGPYLRVKVINNLLYSSGAWHGIAIDNAEDVEVRGNSTLSRQNDEMVFWISLSAIKNAVVEDNVAERLIRVDVEQGEFRNNLILSDDPGMTGKIKGINRGPKAIEGELVLPRRGYQPTAVPAGQAGN
ncbi:right-handed parallel beta-helix repeat-containing protein [Sphingomonas sp. ID1715]|uniref:right-handed parallel beta-helix repeat-containing protein n=1 Tax=Sphingomonas sp. ID1715 TaxID=1656898 RepID=UPI001C2C0E95|nr:right-handed parallel beta-helix repeat-containing protein [Sphingomonas sp. ID1715]